MRATLLVLAACGGATSTAPVSNVASTETPLHAVLVIHPSAPDRAFVLGCMRGSAKLAPDDCAELLVGTELDLVAGAARTTVRVTGADHATVCPSGEEPDEPLVTLAGLPAQLEGPAFLISAGLTFDATEAPLPPLVADQHGPVVALPTKNAAPEPAAPVAMFRVDLDGDGRHELVVEQLGQYTLYDERGTRLGTVGCVFG